jgi:hypothetical protein
MTGRPGPAHLFHFTCTHCAPLIARDGVLVPITDQLTRALPPEVLPLVWLTDLPRPDRDGLGLTSVALHCDRTAARFTVARTADTVPWWEWRRAHPATRAVARVLEETPGARPAHWWVSERPVPIVDGTNHG